MNGRNRREAAGFRKSERHQTADAPARCAARITLSITEGVSVIPGITGIIRTLHRIPPLVSLWMAANRRAGRGARGSIIRWRRRFSVMSEKLTLSRERRLIASNKSRSRAINADLVVIER